MLGGNQERGRRGGTENTPGIVGLGKAAEMAASRLRGDAARMSALRDRLEASLLGQIQDSFVLGDVERRLPNTSALVCEGAEADAIVLLLNRVRNRRLFRRRLLRRLAGSLACRARHGRSGRRGCGRDALFAVARQR